GRLPGGPSRAAPEFRRPRSSSPPEPRGTRKLGREPRCRRGVSWEASWKGMSRTRHPRDDPANRGWRMNGFRAGAAILVLALQASPPATPSDQPVAIELPGGSGGIGFDDLQFSSRLGRVLAPGGRTGRLFLIDPKTLAVSFIEGFSPSESYGGGHGEG